MITCQVWSDRDHLYQAIINGNVTVAKHILSNTTSSTLINDSLDIAGETALTLAIRKNQLEILRILVEEYRECLDINRIDEDGWSALHIASYQGDLEAITFLLSHPKINSRIENFDGFSAIDLCCQRDVSKKENQVQIIQMLKSSVSKPKKPLSSLTTGSNTSVGLVIPTKRPFSSQQSDIYSSDGGNGSVERSKRLKSSQASASSSSVYPNDQAENQRLQELLIEAVESEDQIQQQIKQNQETILELEDALYSFENNLFQRFQPLSLQQLTKQLKTTQDCDDILKLLESNIKMIQVYKLELQSTNKEEAGGNK